MLYKDTSCEGCVSGACAGVSTSHFLLNKRRIDNIGFFNRSNGYNQITWRMIGLSIRIPHFNDIESSLGANRESIHTISRIGRYRIKHCSDNIGKKCLGRIFLLTAKGVTSATNMVMVLP